MGQMDAGGPVHWIEKSRVMQEIGRFQQEATVEPGQDLQALRGKIEGMESAYGVITAVSSWEHLASDDPRLDETERGLFPEETYMCRNCGQKSYFGISCTRDRYCQMCGARMDNTGRRRV